MRNLGLTELLVIAGLVALLIGGARISQLMGWLGKQLRGTIQQARWLYEWLGGSEEDEIRAEEAAGMELAKSFVAEMPPEPDEQVQELVRDVGKKLAGRARARKRRFRFLVVQGSTANAYAVPGGSVFVTKKLVDLCAGDRSELAFLLAHEIGHLTCGHAAERRAMEALLGAVRVGGIAKELLAKGYSREQEREADLAAVDLAGDAGFEQHAALRILRKLGEAGPGPEQVLHYLSTHPNTGERMRCLEGTLSALGRIDGPESVR